MKTNADNKQMRLSAQIALALTLGTAFVPSTALAASITASQTYTADVTVTDDVDIADGTITVEGVDQDDPPSQHANHTAILKGNVKIKNSSGNILAALSHGDGTQDWTGILTINPDKTSKVQLRGDILVGSGISVPADAMLTFYNMPCRVVGRLSPTGTGMDTAVYTNMETMRAMMANAAALDFDYFKDIPPDAAISAVMIRTSEGFTPEGVAAAINEMYPALAARPAHGMVHHVEEGLGGILETIGVLVGVIWLLAVLVLGFAFHLSARERRREFLVLRIAGATRAFLVRMMLMEATLTSAAGGVAGIAVGMLVILPFAGLMKAGLMRPYLLPDGGTLAMLAAETFCAAVLSGALAAAWTAGRVSGAPMSELLGEER